MAYSKGSRNHLKVLSGPLGGGHIYIRSSFLWLLCGEWVRDGQGRRPEGCCSRPGGDGCVWLVMLVMEREEPAELVIVWMYIDRSC